MNEKYLLSQLLADFAEHCSLPKNTQRVFVQQFFALIASALADERQVKVKGLGTFKLMEVAGRRSVDVNTGEAIEIERHTKVSFTPDSEMKAKVNKPFEQFQTVVINENTDLNLMADIPVTEVPTPPVAKEQPAAPTTPLSASGGEETAEPPEAPTTPSQEPHDEVETSKPKNQETESTPPIANERTLAAAVTTDTDGRAPTRRKTLWHIVLSLVVVVALMAFAYWAGYHRVLIGSPQAIADQKPTTTPTEQKRAKPIAHMPQALSASKTQPPTVTNKPHAAKQVPTQIKADAAITAQYPPQEGDKYRIVGSKGKTTLEKGSTLNILSLRTYGSKQYVKYIIRFNRFENPDNLPVGTEVKLPKLERIAQ